MRTVMDFKTLLRKYQALVDENKALKEGRERILECPAGFGRTRGKAVFSGMDSTGRLPSGSISICRLNAGSTNLINPCPVFTHL
jgi:hypothetical protein